MQVLPQSACLCLFIKRHTYAMQQIGKIISQLKSNKANLFDKKAKILAKVNRTRPHQYFADFAVNIIVSFLSQNPYFVVYNFAAIVVFLISSPFASV